MTTIKEEKSADVADLNYDYYHKKFLLKTSMHNLKSTQDKHTVDRWARKLQASNRSTAEMTLRNEFLSLLLAAVQTGELRAPFDRYPPPEPLEAVAYLASGGRPGATERAAGRRCAAAWECRLTSDEQDAARPMLYRKSPDGGAFLSAQPVPKRGAFCYLAVIGKPRAEDAAAAAEEPPCPR